MWTVFELGLFLTLRHGAPITVVPVYLPPLVIGGFLLLSFNRVAREVLHMRAVMEWYPETRCLDPSPNPNPNPNPNWRRCPGP